VPWVPARPRERTGAVQALVERNDPHRSDKSAILHNMWKNFNLKRMQMQIKIERNFKLEETGAANKMYNGEAN
jgi:hypothetical protein